MMHIPIQPPATDAHTLHNLVAEVVDCVRSATPGELDFARRVDDDELTVLKSEFFAPRGLLHAWPTLGVEYDAFIDFVVHEAKLAYPLKRPHALAKQLGIPFRRPANYIRARGGSYPSAHAAAVWFAAYSAAGALSPRDRKALYAFARRVAQSRLVAGVHTRQDIEEGRRLARAAVARQNASTGITPDGLRLSDALGESVWFHGSLFGVVGGFGRPSYEQRYDATFFTNSRELAESFAEGSGSELIAVALKPVRLLDADNLFTKLGQGDALTEEGVRFVECLSHSRDAAEVADICDKIRMFDWTVFDRGGSHYNAIIECVRKLGYRGWIEKEHSDYLNTHIISVALLHPEQDATILWKRETED